MRGETDKAARAAIDASDSTLFGSTSGKTTAINYLRWGKQTFANVRPCRFMTGFKSPLAKPEGIDYVIVRENLEDLYLGLEGPLEALAPLHLHSRILRAELDTSERGKYAVKVITERNTRQVARFACELARKRKAAGSSGQAHLHLEVQYAARVRRLLSPNRRRDRRGLSRYQVRAIHR